METNFIRGMIAAGLMVVLSAHAVRAEKLSLLDNGKVRVGVDLEGGGTISFLARSPGGENLINTFDRGRQVQQSYYSGPQPFGTPHPAWPNWPWNPIGTGDVYGHSSRILLHRNDGRTLYVKSIPMQWALDNVPGDCAFETWVRLEGNAVRVRNRLTNRRADRKQYPARDQELPAVYTIGKLYRLFTYDGSRPFTDRPLTQIHNVGPPWASWRPTEGWAALVNDDGWGVGVIHPDVFQFIGGFAGTPNTGGSHDNSTGYIAPVRQEILDSNIVYEYEYRLVMGDLKAIRADALAHRPREPRPNYTFRRDRQHWTYRDASDEGFPLKGRLRVHFTGEHPQILMPEGWWEAEKVPQLYLKAAFHTGMDRAALYWKREGDGDFRSDQSSSFAVESDSKVRTYTIPLAGLSGYQGIITGLRLDPMATSLAPTRPDSWIEIRSLSWKKPR